MAVGVRDFQKNKTYVTEASLRLLYDNTEVAVVGGVPLQLEPEARFGTIESIQAYVDRVTAMPSVIARFGKTDEITVRERRGDSLAHFEHTEKVIAINSRQSRWAMRELVVLHELAHHYAGASAKHGPRFTVAMTDLVRLVMGPQAALALTILHREGGVL